MLTGRQLRLGRALLGVSQRRLAELCGVSGPTVQRMESIDGEIQGLHSTVTKIERTIADAGIVFVEGGAVMRPRKKAGEADEERVGV